MASNAKYALWLQKAVEDSDLIEELKGFPAMKRKSTTVFTKNLNSVPRA